MVREQFIKFGGILRRDLISDMKKINIYKKLNYFMSE